MRIASSRSAAALRSPASRCRAARRNGKHELDAGHRYRCVAEPLGAPGRHLLRLLIGNLIDPLPELDVELSFLSRVGVATDHQNRRDEHQEHDDVDARARTGGRAGLRVMIERRTYWPGRRGCEKRPSYLQAPSTPRTLTTRNSGRSNPPVPEVPPGCLAIDAWAGSIAPAWAATFGDGHRPPRIDSFFP